MIGRTVGSPPSKLVFRRDVVDFLGIIKTLGVSGYGEAGAVASKLSRCTPLVLVDLLVH